MSAVPDPAPDWDTMAGITVAGLAAAGYTIVATAELERLREVEAQQSGRAAGVRDGSEEGDGDG